MKFLDFLGLFETEPANLAILSTFQLDPDFFERRLLRCRALAKARRIIIFMDDGQWLRLLRQDVPARSLNRRYLVVPVRPSQGGVFHPKLNLLVTEQGVQVQCGSNNLTRSGCSSNLELLNSISINMEENGAEAIHLAREAYEFFKRACDDAEEETGRIARQWIEELPQMVPWLIPSLAQSNNRGIKLFHTYEGSLWNRMATIIDYSPPKKLLVISPFYDLDGGMVKRVHERWPKCQIELVVQQQYTNLPISALRKLHKRISLSELRNSSRRLHAKLVAWESQNGTGCLVGSANFTTAAFDARNVEACLLVSEGSTFVKGLFDKQLDKRPIAFEDFEPGTDQEQKNDDADTTSLKIDSAILTSNDQLRIAYRHRFKSKPTSLRLAIRTPDEQRPRVLINIRNKGKGTDTVTLPETALAAAHGTIFAYLIAEIEGQHEESPPVWVIQEGRLTYEPSGEGSSSDRSKIEETGEGLAELLEEIGNRDGVPAVIEYLRQLNIRFHDGGGGMPGRRKFRIRIRNPIQSDVPPEWLLGAKTQTDDLAGAIYDFVDRHEKQRLRRHANRGNINGMENFIDIFTTLVQLLCIYHQREVVHRYQLIDRLCKYLQIATIGIDADNDYCEGYLHTLYGNLGADTRYIEEVCKELNFLGHLVAALVIVQKIRFIPGEESKWGAPKRQSECLPFIKDKIKNTMRDLGLAVPSKQKVMDALKEYKIFSPEEMIGFEKEIDL